jgi:eukaryotic-like serine/threonine-protein kinase
MGKVFTITEGLENMGALKTGGQGSVYKGRRNGTTITAVKLLPTPIHSESREDKNYIDFQNEVEKLRRVNQTQNPHIVTILNSGITETGSFPFIEMEFIEGPDLEELLKPPHDPVFSIQETIKVARHIAAALAHCHDVDVKHGDMKTNNIKLNSKTGDYVLLDFGLATMSDEQRRTSLRHAGAIEFMAPEQNEGHLVFQSDIYSYGIIIYELLAGKVPFPLTDKGETARNQVMLSHIENQPPDIIETRRQNMPSSWSDEKTEQELNIPAWLQTMILKCLEKDPANRFASGKELYQYISKEKFIQPSPPGRRIANEGKERVALSSPRERRATDEGKENETKIPVRRKRPAMVMVLILAGALALAGFAAYSFIGKSNKDNTITSGQTVIPVDTSALEIKNEQPKRSAAKVEKKEIKDPSTDSFPIQQDTAFSIPADEDTTTLIKENQPVKSSGTKYKVRSKAFFYNQPDETTRREAFIVHWNNAILTPQEERNGFVFVVYTNHLGQTSKGWLRIEDLVKLGED